MANMTEMIIQYMMVKNWYTSSLRISFWTFTVIFAVNNVMTLLSLLFLLIKKPYPKKILRWFVLQSAADAVICMFWVYDLIIFRTSYMDELKDALPSFLYNFKKADPLADFWCKTKFVVLHFPLFLSPMTLAFSSTCRWFTISFPLRAKKLLTNRVNNALIAACFALSLGLTVVDSMSYVLKDGDSLFGKSDAYSCCKLTLQGTCQPLNFSHSFWWTVALNCKMVVMFALYSLCLLTSLGLIYNLVMARRRRDQMGGGSRKNAAETRITAILLTMSLIQFVCCMPTELERAGAIPWLTTEALANQDDLKGIFTGYLVVVILRDMMKVNNLVNWAFYVGMNKQFYTFWLPCLRWLGTKSEASANSVETRLD